MNRREALRWATVLLGGIASPSALRAISMNRAPSHDNKNYFNEFQSRQVATLAELIIPTTSTPGAKIAGVPQVIAMMVSDWYTEAERSIFMAGLDDINYYCQQQYKNNFNACSVEQQTQALIHFESIAKAYVSTASPSLTMQTSDEATPFFSKLKELTVLGYFTSEIGITQSLAYNPMPMEYKADIPLTDKTKQWSQY